MGHKATKFFIDAATSTHVQKGDVLNPDVFKKDAIDVLVAKGLAVDERKYVEQGTVEFDREQAQRDADIAAEAAELKAKKDKAAEKAGK